MVTQIELEFRAAGRGRTQTERLREYLLARTGEWVAMPELARVITQTGIGAAVHSRIADCRWKFGMRIEHRNERRAGVTRSFYRYICEDNGPSERASSEG